MQQTFPCPKCGAQNDIGYRFCGNCGEGFEYRCANCNALVEPTHATCPYCHKELPWETQAQREFLSRENTGPNHEQMKALRTTFRGLGLYSDEQIGKVVPLLRLSGDELLLFVMKDNRGTRERLWVGTNKAVYSLIGKKRTSWIYMQAEAIARVEGSVSIYYSNGKVVELGGDERPEVKREAAAAIMQLVKLVNPSIRVFERDYSEKQKTLKEKVASEPSNPSNYFELGQFLVRKKEELNRWLSSEEGEYEDEEKDDFLVFHKEDEETIYVKECYLKAVALGLSDPVEKGIAHYYLGFGSGYVYDKARDSARRLYHLEEAASELNIVLKSNPEDIPALGRLGSVYAMLGKEREASRIRALAEEIEIRRELKAAPPSSTKNRLQDRTGISFEQKCLELLEKMGFTCRRTATTGDGGIDIVAISNQPLFKGTYIVQCKNWKNPAGEPPVRDLYGVVASENANKGILITSSSFTAAAQNFAKGKNIELIDGDQLEQLIQEPD